MLCILGNNDRALSLATVAKRKGLDVTIIGKYKLAPSLPGEVLRQSINWDLVTGLKRPDFDAWRMDYFLAKNRNYNSQSDIEEPPFIEKDVWDSYISTCQSMLRANGIKFIEKEVAEFSTNYVRFTDTETLRIQNLCIALEPMKRTEPLYIEQEEYNKLTSMLWTHPCPTKILILPTGNEDYSMRAAMYLKDQGHEVVYLFNEHEECRHTDYPIPSFKEWGERSALGNFYRNYVRDTSTRDSYLRKIEAFMPSVRREVSNNFKRSNCKLLKYNSLNSRRTLTQLIKNEQCEYYIDLRAPEHVDLALLPPNDCVLPLRDYPRYPIITEGMRSPNGVYYTGALAEHFDGPRQNYILSSGLTSLEIVEDIIRRR